ncbi:putative serine hydrolase [Orchesella cincta]|uniref:Putative serine hydrolase n=1 Tax=Orchesella cincta TaxID=48709 RepID=A0A1D2NLQ3_ORCCI|nr:putative serine hydrolase [Orchesella cincta]
MGIFAICKRSQLLKRFVVSHPQLVFIKVGVEHDRKLISTRAKFEDYTFNEVGIPVPGGILAGKLWEHRNKALASANVPPIVCLHGWLDNAGTFDLMIPYLITPSTKFFCLDFPGHGMTSYCPEWWYDGHLEGILATRRVAKHFGWDKFSILGHSMGGIVGFLYTAYFPDEVHKLVALENMSTLAVPGGCNIQMMRMSMNLLFDVEERMKAGKKSYGYDEILKKIYEGRLGTISKEGCVALLKRGSSKVDQNEFQFSYSLRTHIPGQEGRTPPEMTLKLANEVTSPVCFIKADPGNKYETKEDSEKFLSVLRKNLGDNFEYHKVPGTHHFHLNDPQLIAPIALKFLTS